MSKPKIIKDYEKLNEDMLEQIKLVYPKGFRKHLISFINRDGIKQKGLPFETEEYQYLIRMSENKAITIIADDDDYDASGNLKEKIKSQYEDKHEDTDFLGDLNSNDDNEFEIEEAEVDLDDEDFSDDD